MSDIASRIRKARRDADLTQQELADRMGISRTMIAVMETREYNPGAKMLERLAKALNVPVSTFFEEKPTTREVYYKLENEEIELLDSFRMLSPAKKETLIETLNYLLSLPTVKPKQKIQRQNKVKKEINVTGSLLSNSKVSIG